MSTGISPSACRQQSILSGRNDASKIGVSNPYSSKTARKLKKVENRKVDLTEENALVLINELYGQKGKSYVRPGDIKVTNSRNLLKKGLDEQKILEKIDHKKTYYNSILSEIKPKFKYKPKAGLLDEDGYSYRAISELGFETESCDTYAKPIKQPKKNKKQTRNIKTLVSEYFD